MSKSFIYRLDWIVIFCYLILVFFGIINVLEWHWIIALLFIIPSLVFIFPKQILNFKIKSKSKNTSSNKYSENSNGYSKKAEPTFNNNSKNDDIIEGDYKIINENKNKRD
jgi:ABC-type multidrug transport system fused ATPase/permease subunit